MKLHLGNANKKAFEEIAGTKKNSQFAWRCTYVLSHTNLQREVY